MSAKLILTINGVLYYVQILRPDPGVAKAAVHLAHLKRGRWHGYDVHVDKHGAHCDCPAAEFGKGKECKHILAAREVGLLPKE